MSEKVDPCRNCNEDLDVGDALEVLSRLDIYKMKSPQEMITIARLFGYTPENRYRFNKIIHRRVEDTVHCTCPVCGYKWDKFSNIKV